MAYKMLIVTTRTDLTEDIIDAVKKLGGGGATILPGRGTGIKEAKTFFGLTLEPQRDTIYFVLEAELARRAFVAVQEAGRFDKPGTGIAFLVDVEAVGGLSRG